MSILVVGRAFGPLLALRGGARTLEIQGKQSPPRSLRLIVAFVPWRKIELPREGGIFPGNLSPFGDRDDIPADFDHHA